MEDLKQITGLLFVLGGLCVETCKTKEKREVYEEEVKELSVLESAPGPNNTAPLLTRVTSADTRGSAAVTRRSRLGDRRRRRTGGDMEENKQPSVLTGSWHLMYAYVNKADPVLQFSWSLSLINNLI